MQTRMDEDPSEEMKIEI